MELLGIERNIKKEYTESQKINSAKNNGAKTVTMHEKQTQKKISFTPEHIVKSLESLKLSPKPGPIEGYPKFEETNLSTKTYIITTNFDLTPKFYLSLPLTKYIVIPKKRGRRKKVDIVDPNANIPDGSIITIIPGDGTVMGVDLKNGDKSGRRDSFGNSITIVMIVDNKKLNFKVCLNGKFQMTGVKNLSQAEKCIKFFWNYIRDKKIYSLRGEHFEAYFRPVMCNIGFQLGFMINREKLVQYFSLHHPYYPSLWENSLGSAGANIKIPISNPDMVRVKKLRYVNGKWMGSCISHGQLRNLFPDDKKKNDKKSDEKYTTFLVFHRGKVNMSSIDLPIMLEPFYRFIQIIQNCREEIEEKIVFIE
jgi:hypothetical protein